jgi:hypothetical protein
LDSQLSGVLKSIGIDASLESAWELIPFSFVVDWFFNTWRILSWFKSYDPSELKVTMTDMSVTVKTFSRVLRRLHWPCFIGDVEFMISSEQYTRTVGPEALASFLPWFKMPSFMQWSYGAALLWLLLR